MRCIPSALAGLFGGVLEGARHAFELGGLMFSQLTAAIADIAVFMDDDEDPNFDAAQQRVIECYRDEMLPALLGGEWSRGQPGVPWSDQYALELFDHPIWFRRRDVHGPRGWQTCAVLGSPYQSGIIDENGEFTLDFIVAAQPLLRQRIGIWANSELSWWDPGQTICVLAATGLESERASRLGFRPVRNGVGTMQDFATVRAILDAAHNSAGAALDRRIKRRFDELLGGGTPHVKQPRPAAATVRAAPPDRFHQGGVGQ
jgi:hypothetical protein